MFKNPILWKAFLMPGSLAGWAFAISGLFLEFDGIIRIAWLTVCAVWMIVHPLEIFISYKIGYPHGKAHPGIDCKVCGRCMEMCPGKAVELHLPDENTLYKSIVNRIKAVANIGIC